jgi:hypothetical protein
MRQLLAATALTFAASVASADERIDLTALDASIKPEARKHWSFQPVKIQPVPSVKNAAWVRNPIDAFVLARLEERGWKPSSAAEPRAILRRVHLDLTGLPPTIVEQDAFLKDPSSAALDRIIDDLLSGLPGNKGDIGSALHYAESNGYGDELKPSVRRYRDYVIKSNDDKPYDRTVRSKPRGTN